MAQKIICDNCGSEKNMPGHDHVLRVDLDDADGFAGRVAVNISLRSAHTGSEVDLCWTCLDKLIHTELIAQTGPR